MGTVEAVIDPVLLAILEPLAGAAFGALLTGFFVQRHWAKRAGESSLIDSLAKDLDALVEKTLEYWSLDYQGQTKRDKENAEKAKALAAKIRASIKTLQSALRGYSERYRRNVDFTGLMSEVQDACTNGAFDAAQRGPDHDRYLTVVNATNRVRATLFQRRV